MIAVWSCLARWGMGRIGWWQVQRTRLTTGGQRDNA